MLSAAVGAINASTAIRDAEGRPLSARIGLVVPQESPIGVGSVQPVQAQTGVVTLLFTDIVSSTALKQRLGDKTGAALIQEERALVRQLLTTCPGAEEIGTAGDSFLLSFSKPSDAVRFALVLQSRLRSLNQRQVLPLQERIGIHLGEVVIEQHQAGQKSKDLFGLQIDTCARVMSLATGGQVLMSRGVFDNARQVLRGEDIEGVGALEWLNHGPYLLKGIEEAVEVCEVREAGNDTLSPPTSSEKAQRQVRADEEQVLGWRPAVGQPVPNTPWVLEQKLGEGGFGEVWVGRHQTTKERRVFKFCFRADRLRSLKREVTLFRLLKERTGEHPNIVRLHEVYLEQPPFYLEEEYVPGQDLRSWCQGQGGIDKVPLETRLEIVAQAAEALQAAHDSGIIHRDVKPGNILISTRKAESRAPEVEVKLSDFGIGQVVSQDYLAGVTKAGFTMTLLGAESSSQTGTQLYMAPELLAGKPVSIRSDIYSLGVVLYQLLVADFTRPVTGDWAEDIQDPLLRDDLKHCLAGRAEDRFTGAGQLAKNLHALPERRAELVRLEAEKAALERAAYRRGIMRMAGLTGVIVVVIAGLALMALNQSRRAKASEGLAQENLYAADMNLAYQAWQENNLGRAVELLNRHRPAPHAADFRGWEWRYLWGLCRSEALYTVGQHSNMLWGVYWVAISPDDRFLATADTGGGGEVRLWDIELRRTIEVLETNDANSSVVFSPDGRVLAFATGHHGVKLWDMHERRQIAQLPADTAGGFGGPQFAFSPDGRQLAIGGKDGKVALWDLPTQTTKGPRLDAHSTPVQALFFLPDGQRLVTAGSWGDHTVRVWSLATGQQLAILTNNTGRIGGAALSPDGKLLATGDWDAKIRIWDLAQQREVAVRTNHTRWISGLAFSPDGKTLASASADYSVKFWETRNWQEVRTLKGSQNEVWGVVFSHDGKTLLTGSKGGRILAWDGTPHSREVVVLRRPEDAQDFFLLSCGTPICIHSNHTFNLWDPKTLRKLPEHPLKDWELWTNRSSMALSPGMERIAMATWSGRIYLLDAEGRRQMPLDGFACEAQVVGFSPNSKLLAAAGHKSLMVWNLENLDVVATLVKSDRLACCGPCFSTNGQMVAVASSGGYVEVWNLAQQQRVAEWKAHTIGATGMAFTPDGHRLATAHFDNKAGLWDLETHERAPERVPLGQTLNAYFSLAPSPDGQRIAAGTWDGQIKIWNSRSGQELVTLKGVNDGVAANLAGQSDLVNGLAFLTPGGNTLISSTSQEARLWRAPSWAEIEAAEKKTDRITQ